MGDVTMTSYLDNEMSLNGWNNLFVCITMGIFFLIIMAYEV